MTAMALNMLAMVPADSPKATLRRGDGGMSEERLSWHLENWATWQFRSGSTARGYPSRAGSGIGVSHGSRTFEEMAETADDNCARAVEAVLGDLTTLERCAVHHEYLSAVYRFPRDQRGHAELYRAARDKIGKALSRRGIL